MTAAAPGTRFRTQGGHMTAYFGLAQLRLPLTPVVHQKRIKKRRRGGGGVPPWVRVARRRAQFTKPRPRRPTSVAFSDRAQSLRLCEPSPVINCVYGTFDPSHFFDHLDDADLEELSWLNQYSTSLPTFAPPPSSEAE